VKPAPGRDADHSMRGEKSGLDTLLSVSKIRCRVRAKVSFVARCFSIGVTASAVAGISCSSPTTPGEGRTALTISNGRARFLNFASVCIGNDLGSGPSIDEVSFEYSNSGFNIIGASADLVDSTTRTRITGAVSDSCPSNPGLASAALYCLDEFKVCRTSGVYDPTVEVARGVIRVYARAPFQAGSVWQIRVSSGSTRSDELSVSVDRTSRPVRMSVRSLLNPPTFTLVRRAQFLASAILPDGSSEDVTFGRALWRSSNSAAASVDPAGNVTAHAPGESDITAVYQGVVGSVRAIVR
jgi:hypothetical protein